MRDEPEGLTERPRELARCIFQIGAFKDKSQSPDGRGFKLKLHEKQPDAPLSPFYLNLRTPDNPKPGPLDVMIVKKIGLQLFAFAETLGLQYTHIAGVPRAGQPFAIAFWHAVCTGGRRLDIICIGKEEMPGGQRQVQKLLADAV